MKLFRIQTVHDRSTGNSIWLPLVGLVLVAVLPLLVFGGGAAWVIVDQKKTALADELAATARALRVAVDHELVNQFVGMDVLASDASLDSEHPAAAFHDEALRAINAHEKWLNAVLIDPVTHKIVAGGLPLTFPAPMTSSPEGVDQVTRTRKPMIAGVFASGTIVKKPIVLFLAPVIRDNAVRFVLAVVMKPDSFSEVFVEQRLNRSWTGAIVDSNMKLAGRSRTPERYVGALVTPTLGERIAAGRIGMFKALTKEGATTYTALSRSATTGWTVAIGVPASEVEGPIHQLLLKMAAAGGGLIAFGLILCGMVGRAIVSRRKGYEHTLQQSQARLESSLQKWGDLIARIPLGVYKYTTLKKGGVRVDFVSERLCELIGVTSKQMYQAPSLMRETIHPDDRPEFDRLHQLAHGSLAPFVWEGRLVRAAEVFWLHVESSATALPSGEVLWNGILYDITERKRAEEGLRESERRYSALFANRLNAIAHCRVNCDQQGRPDDFTILQVNEALETTLGIRKGCIEGYRVREVVPGMESFAFDYIGVLGKIALEGGEIQVETFFEPTRQYLSIYAYSPQPGEFTAIFSDVSAHKQVEEAHARLAEIVRSSDDAIISTDLNGIIIDWNRGAERIFGFPAAEVINRDLVFLIPPEFREQENTLQRPEQLAVGATLGNFESVWLSRDARRIDVSVTISQLMSAGQVVGASKIVRDVTRQKQREAYQEMSREILQILSETADFHDLIRQVLASLQARTGFDAVGIRLQDQDDYPYFAQKGFSGDFLLTENALARQGKEATGCRDKDGYLNLACTCGLVLSGKTDPANPLFSAGGSFWSNDLSPLLDLPPGEDPRFEPRNVCMHQGYASMALVPIRNKGSILGLIQLNSRSQERLSFETVELLEGIASHLGAALVRKQADEEKIKLEDQLQHAQKMESVGRLAGGVAHDFNNMLGVILGHANLALMDLEPQQPLYVNIKEILKAAERSADLTRQLLAFARKQTISPKVVLLNETVAGMLSMLQRIIGEDFDLHWLPVAGTWPVRVDSSQIDQILINLCINARDAISDVGKVTIEAGNCVIDADYGADYKGVVPGEYVRLTVSDNGCGMDKETLALIFEPFFTTKGTGKGTGLGLATVYGAVKQNNGFIYVYSEPGLGTTFSVFLPRWCGEVVQVRAEGAPKPAQRGHETILLVEDEPAILNVATLLLTRQGYTVLAADSPGAAIRLAADHADGISLLLTDVVMPEMNGRDLARELTSRHPQLKRLFMSGFTADVIANHGAIDEGVHFIQKPFSVHSLSAKVREVLDSE